MTFTETVPYYEDVYESLGTSWSEREPTGLEQQLLLVIDGLSTVPAPLEELEGSLGLDHADMPRLLDVGKGAGLIHVIRTIDGDLAYSPFFGFENPDLFADERGPLCSVLVEGLAGPLAGDLDAAAADAEVFGGVRLALQQPGTVESRAPFGAGCRRAARPGTGASTGS